MAAGSEALDGTAILQADGAEVAVDQEVLAGAVLHRLDGVEHGHSDSEVARHFRGNVSLPLCKFLELLSHLFPDWVGVPEQHPHVSVAGYQRYLWNRQAKLEQAADSFMA